MTGSGSYPAILCRFFLDVHPIRLLVQLLRLGINVNSETDNKQFIKKKTFAKALEQNPRLTELIYLKNRYGQANEKVYFKYFPELDFFEPDYNL